MLLIAVPELSIKYLTSPNLLSSYIEHLFKICLHYVPFNLRTHWVACLLAFWGPRLIFWGFWRRQHILISQGFLFCPPNAGKLKKTDLFTSMQPKPAPKRLIRSPQNCVPFPTDSALFIFKCGLFNITSLPNIFSISQAEWLSVSLLVNDSSADIIKIFLAPKQTQHF